MDPYEPNERQPLLDSVLQSDDESDSPRNDRRRGEYVVYKRRWFVLAVLSLLNLSNGLLWISFSPIADFTATFFHITTMQVNWLAIIYMVINIPLGFGAMWLLDVFGLRVGLISASWLNGIGAGLRVVACMDFLSQHWRYPVLMVGQGLTGCAQPLIMFATTKLAAQWFGDRQRALANMIGSMANPIGILLGNLLSTAIVLHADQLPLLMKAYAAPAALGTLLATFGICSAVPPTPPSISAAEMSEPFLKGVRKVLTSKSFLILMICYGGGFGIVTTLITLLQQLLCPHGYSDFFAGLCGALMFGVGLLGAGCAAVVVDKTKKFEEVAKGGLSLSCTFLFGFLVLSRYPNSEVPLAILLSLVGFFGFAITPVCLELGVECTFPAAEATSTGFIILVGQIQALIFTILLPAVAPTLSSADFPQQTCSLPDETILPQDYTFPNMVFSGIAAFLCVLFTIFFKCEYKRLRAEEQLMAERILNFCRDTTIVINA